MEEYTRYPRDMFDDEDYDDNFEIRDNSEYYDYN